MFSLHCIPEILYAQSIDTELIIRNTSVTDRQTEGRTRDRRKWYRRRLQHSCN